MIWALLVMVYTLPSWIAVLRLHPDMTFVFWVNMLLGWTIMGWILALLWSISPKEA